MTSKRFTNQLAVAIDPGGRGGHSLIWPRQVRAAQQGLDFRVLHFKQGIQFHYLVS